MKFHHIGIACEEIEPVREDVKRNHKVVDDSGIIFDEVQNAKLCLLTLEEGVKLELVSGEVVKSFCKKGIKYYHICYEVEDIEDKYNELVNNNFIPVTPLQPAKLFNMRKVGFLYSSYGLIELLESPTSGSLGSEI